MQPQKPVPNIMDSGNKNVTATQPGVKVCPGAPKKPKRDSPVVLSDLVRVDLRDRYDK